MVMHVGGCPNTCCNGASVFNQDGMLTISAVDDASVTLSLAGTNGNTNEGTVAADGAYTVIRCP